MNEPILIRKHDKYCEIVGKKNKPKTKECFFYKNNHFFKLDKFKLVIMSDLHSLTEFIIDDLIKKKIIDENTIVITLGDMSGESKRIGGNGDPYESYKKILKHSNKFYFVQGNHDMFDNKFTLLVNDDSTPCMADSILIDTPIGTIAGVNGIETDENNIDPNYHKYSSNEYNEKILKMLEFNPDIFLSHQPITHIDHSNYKTKYYMSGHYKIDPFIQIKNETVFINADNKIIIFE
jgi:predicted MPP superfamily phosphohydrolase